MRSKLIPIALTPLIIQSSLLSLFITITTITITTITTTTHNEHYLDSTWFNRGEGPKTSKTAQTQLPKT